MHLLCFCCEVEDRLVLATDKLLRTVINSLNNLARDSDGETFSFGSLLSRPNQAACSAVLSSHVLQPFVRLGGPQLCLLQFVRVPELDAVLQMWSHKCWIEGNNNFLDFLDIFLIKLHSMRLASNAAEAQCWIMFSLSSRSPRSFFQSCIPINWPLDYPRFRPLLNMMSSCLSLGTDAHFAHPVSNWKCGYLFVYVSTSFIDSFCSSLCWQPHCCQRAI